MVEWTVIKHEDSGLLVVPLHQAEREVDRLKLCIREMEKNWPGIGDGDIRRVIKERDAALERIEGLTSAIKALQWHTCTCYEKEFKGKMLKGVCARCHALRLIGVSNHAVDHNEVDDPLEPYGCPSCRSEPCQCHLNIDGDGTNAQ
jgi:hypothetical protein